MTKAECEKAAMRVAWALNQAGLPATLGGYGDGFLVEVLSEDTQNLDAKQLINITITPSETYIWIGFPTNRVGVPLERW